MYGLIILLKSRFSCHTTTHLRWIMAVFVTSYMSVFVTSYNLSFFYITLPIITIIIDMEHSRANMEELYANLRLEDEEEGAIIVGADELKEKQETFVLVGKFLTEKNINFGTTQNVLASV